MAQVTTAPTPASKGFNRSNRPSVSPRPDVEVRKVGVGQPPPEAPSVEPEVGQKPETQFRAARPTFAVSLPSKGRFYGSQLPDGMVEVYLMTATEDKILADLTPDNVPEIFDAILARCVKSPISPEELIETDRYYLLLMLREFSLGDEFKFPFECPEQGCGHTFVHTAHIPGDFEMVEGSADQEPFFVKLPSGANVGLKLMRGKDSKEINRYRRTHTNTKDERGDSAYAYQNAKSIATVDGKAFATSQEAMNWFMALPLKDVKAFKAALATAYPGVINVVKITCPRCEKETVTRVPLSPLYFFE